MISIRPFEEADGPRLLQIQRLCPQGDEKLALGGDRKQSIIARYRMYDDWNVLVAEVDGAVAGWIGMALKRPPQETSQGTSHERSYVYLAEVMVHPEFRGRGVGTELVGAAEEWASGAGADHIYGYTYDTNCASRSLLGGLGYSDLLELKQYAVPVLRKADVGEGFSIERMDRGDIPEAVDLINDFNAGRTHFEPFTPEGFEARVRSIPGYGLENLWVAKDGGRIAACAGLWDSSVLAEVYYAREPLEYRVMGKIFRLLGQVIRLPVIPAEGEVFRYLNLEDWAFMHEDAGAISSLLRHFNNILLEGGRYYLVTMIDPADPLARVLKGLRPSVEAWRVYAKELEGGVAGWSPYYVDMRDMVL